MLTLTIYLCRTEFEFATVTDFESETEFEIEFEIFCEYQPRVRNMKSITVCKNLPLKKLATSCLELLDILIKSEYFLISVFKNLC